MDDNYGSGDVRTKISAILRRNYKSFRSDYAGQSGRKHYKRETQQLVQFALDLELITPEEFDKLSRWIHKWPHIDNIEKEMPDITPLGALANAVLEIDNEGGD